MDVVIPNTTIDHDKCTKTDLIFAVKRLRGDVADLEAQLTQAKAGNARLVEGARLSKEALAMILGNTRRIVTDDADEIAFKAYCLIDKALDSTPHPGAALLEELEQYKKALELACEQLSDETEGFCPVSKSFVGNDFKPFCPCNGYVLGRQTVHNSECWRDYFLARAKEATHESE